MHKPFAALLEGLVQEGRITSPEPVLNDDLPETFPDGLSDDALFDFAMHDVHSLGWSAVPLHPRMPLEIHAQSDEHGALRALEECIRSGKIELEHTSEYVEGAAGPEGRLYLGDLRSGRFSVRAHIDLHGLNQQEARFALGEFIVASARANLGCVRVIHGRGHHSQDYHAVLKESVQRWLCSRRIGRHVLAFTSARRCDGGGGAVYVLLRR